MSKTKNKAVVVVIGHGMVGHHFLEQLVNNYPVSEMKIIVYGKEKYPAYDRVHLSEYFSGRTFSDLSMVKNDFFSENGIELQLSNEVIEINRNEKYILDHKGNVQAYDYLVFATGSYPFVPPVPGHDLEGCLTYRTLDDLEAISARSHHAKRGVVVGGGLLGLEAANALKNLGLETHVVEFSPRLMAVQLDDMGASMLRSKIEALGVTVHTSKNTQKIISNNKGGLTMCFSNDEMLDTDLILFSAGIRPEDKLARLAGLELAERGGIAINDACQTSDPSIWAIGECAAWQSRIYGLVAPGYQMARTVAANIMGGQSTFTGADMSTKLKLMGVEVASIGDAHGTSLGCKSYQWINEPEEVYKKIVVSEDGKTLLGAVLVGDASEYSDLLQLKLNDIALPKSPESLILPQQAGSPTKALGVAALPDTAQICSCHNVTKLQICNAVGDGAHTMGAIKECTKAATGCGGCTALVKQVVEFQLAAQGFEVKKDICEHFGYSRQELHHLIRVGEIRDFRTLIERYGQGDGCEVCKPLVGSLLASCWNEYLLKPQHLPLQDTNDRYFANIQKDGTYSIVPRVPAGEITPDRLIVIGNVAKKYGLYTKITGGQRIDLFGAQLAQLPEIWRTLVDAGFETGHAYGKSLRTVKSCVGSTWCRYGVQDSTGLAVLLENRYKGLRSPHKLKMAVSGCTRECAEAQSKDIGVIATDKGWNLYVCGNGGMKPRHADLFASDLDDETLISYVDRILMFYIRTGDRLQRTSVWMDNMEGGLEYLRDVVINDSLGINDELEAEMNRVIGTWQCEWKTTLESPDRLALFRPTVNSDAPDETIRWDIERDQIRPSNSAITRSTSESNSEWTEICDIDAVPDDAGIGARVGESRVALFRLHGQFYALDDYEPGTNASVLSRGILGDVAGDAVVISPLYKYKIRLSDGKSVDSADISVGRWDTKVVDGKIHVSRIKETEMSLAV